MRNDFFGGFLEWWEKEGKEKGTRSATTVTPGGASLCRSSTANSGTGSFTSSSSSASCSSSSIGSVSSGFSSV